MTLLASGIMVEQALKAADQLEAQGVSVQVIDLFVSNQFMKTYQLYYQEGQY